MYIPIALIILFLFFPDLAVLCGILALIFMFPQISISVIIIIFLLSAFGKFIDFTEKTKTIERIINIIKKIFYLNINIKAAKWKQCLILFAWWLFLSIFLTTSSLILNIVADGYF